MKYKELKKGVIYMKPRHPHPPKAYEFTGKFEFAQRLRMGVFSEKDYSQTCTHHRLPCCTMRTMRPATKAEIKTNKYIYEHQ